MYVPEVPIERLAQRLDFLESRANAHIVRAKEDDRLSQNEEMLARACAATLWRDAGCVALLMNEVHKALNLLTISGREFLALGLPSGARLVALGSLRESSYIFEEFGDVVEGTREQWTRSKARERDRRSSSERRKPTDQMSHLGREAPRQIFSMMQADWLTTEIPSARSREREEPMLKALERNEGHPAGETGLSIGTYFKIAEWFTEQRRFDAEPPATIFQSMETLAATRAEHLRAAQKDTFHWRQLARPAELMDLDATVLMFLGLGSGMSFRSLKSMMEREVAIVDAPLEAAASLRRAQDLPVI